MRDHLIVLVEDEPEDRELTLRAIEKADINCDVNVVRDGAELVDYVFCTGAYANRDPQRVPQLILLDLKMPRLDGHQALEVLRSRWEEGELLPPVVILTSSDREDDIVQAYRLGAHGYARKPIDFSRFVETIKRIAAYWLSVNQPPPRLAKRS